MAASSRAHYAVDLLVNLTAGIGLLYGARWHWKSELDEEYYPRIGLWMLLIATVLVSLGVITLFLGSQRVLPGELLEVVQVNLGYGLLGGLLIGTTRSLTIQQTRAATRAEAEAEAVESERQRLAELNDLLRHYVLNAVNVIDGHASLIPGADPDDRNQSAVAIRNQARNITEIVENLKLISDFGPTPSESVDLDQSLRHASEQSTADSGVSFELPTTDLQVQANSSLTEAFEVLCHVLARSTESGGTISVTVDRRDDRAVVTAEAYPASLPQHVIDSIFEPIGTDYGLKLFIANKIISRFGELSLDECGEDTVVFECRLQVADASG